MVTIALVVLFLMQLISIFVILILNSKIAKFKDLEVRQDRLVREMDDAISMYLLDMREENNRLIQELKSANIAPAKVVTQVVRPLKVQEEHEEISINPQTVETLLTETRTILPKTVVANAYNKHKEHQSSEQVEKALEQEVQPLKKEEKELPSFEQEVLSQHRAGLTVEEIAKKMQRGKTEIELLIKFHA